MAAAFLRLNAHPNSRNCSVKKPQTRTKANTYGDITNNIGIRTSNAASLLAFLGKNDELYPFLNSWIALNSKNGARSRSRTGTVFPPRDFKSLASTNFAIRARMGRSTSERTDSLSGESPKWRRRSESNRRTRLCRPLHDHSATPPFWGLVVTLAIIAGRSGQKKPR